MASKLEGTANCLQFVDCTLDAAKENDVIGFFLSFQSQKYENKKAITIHEKD